MPHISLEEVRRVADLARLSLSDAEVAALRPGLEQLLAYVARLDELDTSNVEPTAQGVAAAGRLRADAARSHEHVDELLRAAPERVGEGFGVPKIIE